MRNDSLPDPDVGRMLSQLASLVECNTCFPPGDNYPAMVNLLRHLCEPLHACFDIIEVPEELWSAPGAAGVRLNLLATPSSDELGIPEVLIYFHVDTATVGDGWTRDPFLLSREGNLLFGRGTADMKGTIVAVLDALLRLRQAGSSLQYKPVLAFCTDEEGGRYPGIRYLAENHKLPETLLNLNGSAANRIWAGCFGSMTLELHCTGRSAHSGTPESGINAVEAALPALLALTTLKSIVEQRQSAMPASPTTQTPLTARLNITAVAAGDTGSALPGECRIIINRRYCPEECESDVRNEIEDVISRALCPTPLLSWSLSDIGHLPPVSDPDGRATDRWTAARAAATGTSVESFQRYGSTTSSDFGWVQRAGIQHLLLGGLSRPDRNVHGPDEHTSIDDLIALSRSVEYFLSAGFTASVPVTQAAQHDAGSTSL